MGRRGWRWFAAWTVAGALVTFTVLGAASIGLFVAPFAILAVWWALRRGGLRAETAGAFSGMNLVVLSVAALQAGPDGVNARPWFAAGLLLGLGGVLAYLAARRRQAEPPSAVARRR